MNVPDVMTIKDALNLMRREQVLPGPLFPRGQVKKAFGIKNKEVAAGLEPFTDLNFAD